MYKVLTLGGDELWLSVRKVFHGKNSHGVGDRPRGQLQQRLQTQADTTVLPLGRVDSLPGVSRMVKRVGFAVELSLSVTSRPARNGRNLHNLSGLVAEGKSRRSATRASRAGVS